MTQDAKAEEEIRTLRQALLDAGRRNDRAALEQMIADGFTFIHSTGSIDTKKQWIDPDYGDGA
ncbi:MAG: nuclear transport factor 2 family protein [Pyrinomonadaceae bacterium]|nr:nuclear transport factor 2 family protein [Pyrinomonadaceae bacterium]